MAEIFITKEFSFESCHHLENYIGKCQKPHGHSYRLEVTLCGDIDKSTGMLLDFKILKTMVESLIIDKFDHENLNEVLDYNPTAELMAMDIFDTIALRLSSTSEVKVHSIKLWETANSSVTYYGG